MGVLELRKVTGKFPVIPVPLQGNETLQRGHQGLEQAEPARRFLSGILRLLIDFA